MVSRLSLLLVSLALAGCSSDNRMDHDTTKMEMQSENCRSIASDAAGHLGMDHSSRQKLDAYDTAYRDCMAARGYAIAPSTN
jgi:hypothetical protein